MDGVTSTTPAQAAATRRATAPSPEAVLLLQSVRSYPSVSLLATTTPGRRMSATDARTVGRLADEAAQRLRDDPSPDSAEVIRALDETVARVVSQPTGRAIGVFVNSAMREVVRLAIPVTDRVVVDPTFATRDLLRGCTGPPGTWCCSWPDGRRGSSTASATS